MVEQRGICLSVVVPVRNEASGVIVFHEKLMAQVTKAVGDDYEVIYCNDGSTDKTPELVLDWNKKNNKIKLISFSRNFGKEYALSAGIAEAEGQAILTIDGDGQHPVELIEEFVSIWRNGAQVVIGVRTNDENKDHFKEFGSKIFYRIFNRMTNQKLVPGSTDYRLIDRSVQHAFLELKENNRITRGLIDWLGFKREYVYFKAKKRNNGKSRYSRSQLIQLAANSFVSLTPKPLYIFGYLGIIITALSFILGTAIIIEQLLLGDPLKWNFTGTAMLGVLIIFLVGITLISQAILSLYISHIQSQSQQRPLYIVDYRNSAGIKKLDV